MNTKFLVSLITVLVLLAVVPLVSASVVSITKVELDGMDVSSNHVSVEAGETVSLRVEYTAGENASDVEISAWLRGYKSDIVRKALPDLIDGKEYNAKLSLTVPKNLDETEEELTLTIEIETDDGSASEEYTLNVQRKPYNPDLLFVEADNKVEAGSSAEVDIVVKNLGRHELDDLVIRVSIPALGISKRVYAGDLTPTNDEAVYGEDATDAVEGKFLLKIPATAEAGVYDLIVDAYNSDAASTVKKQIEVTGAEQTTKVLVPVTSKEISMGEVKSYDLVIVNSGDNIGVYELIPETAEGVTVMVEEPIVTVKAGESKVVTVKVQAGTRDGKYSFAVNVNSQGKLIQRVVMNADVVKGKIAVKGNLTILTVILAIIFIVLLIVLIVLLTRRPSKSEELEESYY